MPEIRAFLFDMDGVILDSNPLHRQSWAEYNRRHGVETTEAMQQQRPKGEEFRPLWDK